MGHVLVQSGSIPPKAVVWLRGNEQAPLKPYTKLWCRLLRPRKSTAVYNTAGSCPTLVSDHALLTKYRSVRVDMALRRVSRLFVLPAKGTDWGALSFAQIRGFASNLDVQVSRMIWYAAQNGAFAPQYRRLYRD